MGVYGEGYCFYERDGSATQVVSVCEWPATDDALAVETIVKTPEGLGLASTAISELVESDYTYIPDPLRATSREL